MVVPVDGIKGVNVAEQLGHEYWLSVCRAKLTGHHSKAKQIWDRMTESRRSVLLHAAGMKSMHCRSEWADFSNRELRQLMRGIQRLKVMVEMFGAVGELDFIQPVQKMPANVERRREAAIPMVNDILNARNELKNRINNKPVNH